MFKIDDFDLLMKILLQWGLVFIVLVLVFLVVFFVERRVQAPLQIILKPLVSNLD